MTRASFTVGDAQRIANAVRVVEQGNRNEAPLTFRRVLESGRGGKAAFHVATFTGSWSTGALKIVTLKYVTSTPNTVSVTNLYLGIDPSTACDALIANDGSAWYLVQADLTKQPNYSSNGTHVFTIADGDMEWLGVESCPDDEASPTSKAFFFG